MMIGRVRGRGRGRVANTQAERERRQGREGRTQGGQRDKKRNALEELGLNCSGPLQATAQNRALLIFFRFFYSSAVRIKGEVSQRKLHCLIQSGESQEELSRDEPRRVFTKATLLSEGGMAMEYGLPFQEGRMQWVAGWIWMDRFSEMHLLLLLLSLLCLWRCFLFCFSPVQHKSFFWSCSQIFTSPQCLLASLPPSFAASLFLRWLICMACL